MPKSEKRPAPYIPFKTFQTALETLEQGCPEKIDRSVWPSLSFSVQAHTLSAFRFLRLIDKDGNTQEDLWSLVIDPQKRKVNLKDVLVKRYPDVAALGDTNATEQQLEEAMKRYDVSGEMLDKAIRFFLQAAKYVELSISPLWKAGRRKRAAGAKRASRPPRSKNGQSGDRPPTPAEDDENLKVVTLSNGGTVKLVVDVDVTKMTTDERNFLFGIIDKMNDFEKLQEPLEVEEDVLADNGEGGETTE
ncbi:MAG: hypothetical protein IH959_10035 [Chloroflexi bacterium]|nr:hypothetical protein [Chloroflexota bacterium]